MKVSIIVPNYNHSDFLAQRIESILAQTYQDFELIILDDNSSDNSCEVIERYRGHDRISHIIINDTNSGNTFKQWDRGFALAQGEYIWIAESDDYANEHFLEMCVKSLDENPTASACFSDSYFITQRGKISNKYKGLNDLIIYHNTNGAQLTWRRHNQTILYNGFEFVKEMMLKFNYMYNASMVLFRKDALSDVSSLYTMFKGCGDWIFWIEMILRHDVARVPQRLNYFRQHKNKVSSNNAHQSNYIIESTTARYYILNLLCSEGRKRGMSRSAIRVIQRSAIDTILAWIRVFIHNEPSRKSEAVKLRHNVKRHFWYVCYLQPAKRRVKELLKIKRKRR